MNLFGEDMIIGDFKLSDYGLILASFESDSGTGEDELGMDYETIEEFIGNNPVPVYLGAKYSNKLKPTATIIKNPCTSVNDPYFTEHECRDILRQLTGFYGYKQMHVITENPDELLYYFVRVVSANYHKIGGKVAGIILNMECDSQFAWSKEYNFEYTVTAGQEIMFYNTSDVLYDYLKPIVTIKSEAEIGKNGDGSDSLFIKNLTDNEWTTEIYHMIPNEIITMDSKLETMNTTNEKSNVLNKFNFHFIRFVSGINKIKIGGTWEGKMEITISFRYPRKVGFL